MIWCASVFYEPGIGCVSGIAALVLLLDSVQIEKSKLDRIIEALLIVLFSFVTFGYRANAFTIIPVIVVYVLILQCSRMKKLIALTSLFVGFILIPIFAKLFCIDTMSSVSAGFTWEILTVIQRFDLEKQEQYINYLDEIGEGGGHCNRNSIQ